MAKSDSYGNNNKDGGGKQKKKQTQQRQYRESDGKQVIRSICKWGRPALFMWIFAEADNYLQAGLMFVWRGFGWNTGWIDKWDFLFVWGIGLGGYTILWSIETYLLNDRKH